MADDTHLEVLEKGVARWNEWRSENPEVIPDLSGAQLQEAYLREVDFSRANLTRAILIGVDFRGANLAMADLSQADLRFARLRGAKLTGAALATAKGVDRGLLRSTMRRGVSNQRIAAMIAIPLLAIGFTYAGVLNRLSSRSSPVEAADRALSDAPERASLTHFFAAEALSREAVAGVSLRERTIELRLSSGNISQVGYLLALRGFCTSLELHDTPASELEAIRVMNSDGTKGWVFEEPRLCAELTRSDVPTMDATVLGHSHPIE